MDEKKLIKDYEPLITRLSLEYYASSSSPALSLDDFLQEGRIGFITAIRSYDEEKGKGFAAYVENGIRMALRKLLSEQARIVRFPKHRIEQLSKLSKAEKTAGEDNDAICSITGFKQKDVDKLRQMRISANTFYLDEKDDEDDSFIDLAFSSDFSSDEDDNIMLEKIESVIDDFSEEDAYILKSISGTFGCKKKTRKTLSKELDMSISKIAYSYNRSISSLRQAL